MAYIEIEELDLLGKNDNGATWSFETLTRSGFIWAERKAGSMSGNHFHKGISDSKNPEILLLTKGQAELSGQLQNGEEVFREKLEGPILVKIYPNVIHTIVAITDIQFLEFNSIAEHKADTFYPAND